MSNFKNRNQPHDFIVKCHVGCLEVVQLVQVAHVVSRMLVTAAFVRSRPGMRKPLLQHVVATRVRDLWVSPAAFSQLKVFTVAGA